LGGRTIDVVDAITGERAGTWATTHRRNVRRASQELLAAVALPRDLRIPRRRTRPTGETVPISFFDVYRYLYLDQNSIDNSVVGHNDQNLNVKRIAVFELLYGLSNPRVMELAAQRGRYAQEADKARTAARNVADFLRANAELDPAALDRLRREAEERRAAAESRLTALRTSARPAGADAGLAQQVSQLRARLTELESERQALRRDVEKDRSVLAQLELDEQAAKREAAARDTLTGLEFMQCPRCLQSITEREVAHGNCILCCQPQPENAAQSTALVNQIRDQRKETQALFEEDTTDLERITQEADNLRDRLARALELSEQRTRIPADPLLDDIADASRAAAEATALLDIVVAAQARWASHRQLTTEADEADRIADNIAKEEARLRLQLEQNTTRLADLSQVFNEILASLRDPWYREAHVDSKTYLPVVDGEEFDLLSVGGARKTLVNLAYHLANLSMSISERENVLMPTLLIVDSPRKNVGEGTLDRTVVEAIYRRLHTLQDASGDRFQIIIADNELPQTARSWVRSHIQLDYDHPFVPGVVHPGEDVETLGDQSTVDLE